MNIVLYLAGSIAFLFCFLFFGERTDDHASFVYLQYSAILLTFFCLMLAFKEYASGRPKRLTSQEQQTMRRQKWLDQKADRRERRRY